MDTLIKVKYKLTSFLCLHNKISKKLLLRSIVAFNIIKNNDDDINLRNTLSMDLQHMGYGYNMHKIGLRVQANQSPIFSLLAT